MKKKNLTKIGIGFCFLFLVVSCKKDAEKNLDNDFNLTKEIAKIETIYHEGDLKIEGMLASTEPETYATEALRSKIQKELEESYSKQSSYIGKGNELWAVFEYNNCHPYKSLVVFMDCQDGGNSWVSNAGASYADGNKNLYLKFCVLPNYVMMDSRQPHGALNLTSDFPDGIDKLKIYFDNEDTRNKNRTTYDGSTYYGWMGDNWFGNNTQLVFGLTHYYDGLPECLPTGPIPHLVLGSNEWWYCGPVYEGTIFSDDENSSNANSVYISHYNFQTYSWDPWILCPSGYYGYCANSNTNTTLNLITAMHE